MSPPSFILQGRTAATDAHGIPKNSRIWILLHSLHRNKKYWSEPNSFNPDRFKENPHDGAWMPFGSGTRQCPGRNFALNEIEAVMRVILSRFSIHLPADSPHQDYLKTPWSNILIPKDLKLVLNHLDANHQMVASPRVPLLPIKLSLKPLILVALIGLIIIKLSALFK